MSSMYRRTTRFLEFITEDPDSFATNSKDPDCAFPRLESNEF